MFNFSPSKDWILLFCIGFTIVAVGHTIDFFLSKHEVKKIHIKFKKFAGMLNHNTLSKWQYELANFTINALNILHDAIVYLVIMFANPGSLLSSGKTKIFKKVLVTLLMVFFALGGMAPCVYLDVMDKTSKYWIIGIFLLPLTLITCLIFYSLYKRTLINERKSYYECIPSWADLFVITFYSSLLTFIAMIISIYFLPDIDNNSYWFTTSDNNICPTFPGLLSIINSLFDYFTILLMLIMLKAVVMGRIRWGFVVLINIVWSGFLCFILYSILLAVEKKSGIFNFHLILYESAIWAKNFIVIFFKWTINDTITIKINQIHNIRLVPIILTTFVPVSLFMSIFIVLSMSKPVIRLSSRLFKIMGEKDESVFKQLGVLISVWMFAAKAFYDYLKIP